MNYLSDNAKTLSPYVAGLQPQGDGWVKLNTNENPYPPSPQVLAAIKGAKIDCLRLYPDGDSSILCKSIADSLHLPLEQIFIGNSSDEVLALAFAAFFRAKDSVFMPEISYGFYPVWSQLFDVGATRIPLEADFTIHPGAYRDAKGVILANPNAPTSLALTLEEIEEIVRQNPAGVVLIDEAYIDFANVESAVKLIPKYENLLVVRTFSKSHSLAGLRVGYALGQAPLIQGLQRVKNAFNSYPLDMLAQIGAKAAIQDRAYFHETRRKIIATRDRVSVELCKLNYPPLLSQTNFLFVQAKEAKALYEHLLAHQILVRYWNTPRLSDFLRVTLGRDEEMEAFLTCVKQF